MVETNEAPSHDPWAPAGGEQDPHYSYLDPPKSIKPPSTLQKAPISLLASAASLPAVPKPKPGISYNPVFQDWDALLTSAGAAEVAAERKSLADAAAEQKKQAVIAAAQNEREHDDYKTEDESAWEGFESENEAAEWLKRKRPERKTPTERNKAKRRKEAERQAKREAQMKKREQQARQIGNIAKDVEKEAKARANSTTAMIVDGSDDNDDGEDIADPVLRRKKLGKHKYVPRPPLLPNLPSPPIPLLFFLSNFFFKL